MENPARTALSRAVNRAIAEGAPVYRNIPAVTEVQDMIAPEGVKATLQRAHNGRALGLSITDDLGMVPRSCTIDLDTAAARALRDRLTAFVDYGR